MAELDLPQALDYRGERPSLTGARRQEIQDLLQKRVLVTGDIATHLETLSGFDVAGYIPRRATANSIAESRFPLADQLAILSHAVCTVVGYVIDHPASAPRLQILAGAFQKGIGVIREHALDYFQTMMVPANHNRLVKLINYDLTDWSSELFRAGVIAGSKWLEPPPVGQLPAVVVPIWTRLDAFLNSGGLIHVEEQAAERPAKQRKMDGKTTPRVCFSWASKKSWCRLKQTASRNGSSSSRPTKTAHPCSALSPHLPLHVPPHPLPRASAPPGDLMQRVQPSPCRRQLDIKLYIPKTDHLGNFLMA